MAVILKQGKPPEPPRPPWYLTKTLICRRCDAHFMLEEKDIKPDGPWYGRNEKHLGGKQEMIGPCPCCGVEITIDSRA